MSTYVNDPHVNNVIAAGGQVKTRNRDIAEVARQITMNIGGSVDRPCLQSVICSLRTAKKMGHLRFVQYSRGGYICEISSVPVSDRRRTEEKRKRVTRSMLAAAMDASSPSALRGCRISA